MSKPLKSAYELAMEKLRQGGDEAPAALSDDQKRRIAEVRAEAKARRAELEIMHKAALRSLVEAGDADGVAKQDAAHEEALRKAAEDERSRVEAIRGEPASG